MKKQKFNIKTYVIIILFLFVMTNCNYNKLEGPIFPEGFSQFSNYGINSRKDFIITEQSTQLLIQRMVKGINGNTKLDNNLMIIRKINQIRKINESKNLSNWKKYITKTKYWFLSINYSLYNGHGKIHYSFVKVVNKKVIFCHVVTKDHVGRLRYNESHYYNYDENMKHVAKTLVINAQKGYVKKYFRWDPNHKNAPGVKDGNWLETGVGKIP